MARLISVPTVVRAVKCFSSFLDNLVYTMTPFMDYPLSVLYIESCQNYVQVYYVNGAKKIIRTTMNDILNQLPQSDFARIHNRWIVNLSRVKNYAGNSRKMEVELVDSPKVFNVARNQDGNHLLRNREARIPYRLNKRRCTLPKSESHFLDRDEPPTNKR